MQLTIHIPDDVIAEYQHVLPPPEMGLLETIAVDAILGALSRFAADQKGEPDAKGRPAGQ
jgi:hypothetical protein